MTGHKGNSEYCFPKTLHVPRAKLRGTMRLRGNKTHCLPRGQSLVFVIHVHADSKIEKAPKNYLLDAIAYIGCARKIEWLPKPTCHIEKNHDNSLFSQLTKNMWSMLLQSEKVFELGGITKFYIQYRYLWINVQDL